MVASGTISTFCSFAALGMRTSASGAAGLGTWLALSTGGGEGWVGGESRAAGAAAGVALRNNLPSLLKPLFFVGAWVGVFPARQPGCKVTTAYGAPGT
jgi:hypothetical protein